MTFDENTYQKIQRYLDKELTGKELEDFKKALKSNKNLAQEVTLQKDMAELLADSPENELRKNLQMLSAQVDEDPSKTGFPFKHLLWIIPIALVAGWFFFSSRNATPTETVIIPPINKEEPQPIETKPENNASPAKETSQEKEESTVPERPTQNDQPKKKEAAPSPRPIAANFEPNPSIEFLISNNLRASDFEFTVEKKQDNIKLSAPSNPFKFQFAATIKSEQDLSEQDFKLHLFSNKKADFENFQTLSTFGLPLEVQTDNTYQFELQQTLNLPPGLYYYIIEDLAEEKIYFVEKFEVRVGGKR